MDDYADLIQSLSPQTQEVIKIITTIKEVRLNIAEIFDDTEREVKACLKKI